MLILAAGAMGTPPILMRSRGDLPSLSDQVGRHLGVNGDHVAAIEYDPRKIRDVLGLPGYGEFYKGKPITTMTYDFWVGRRAHRFDGTRFTLQEIFLSSLTNFLYDDGRSPAGDPSWWGVQKKRAISKWSNRIELLAMVEDTQDGRFDLVPPQGGGVRPNAGPVVIGTVQLHALGAVDPRARAGRPGDGAGGRAPRPGEVHEADRDRGAYAAHPLGGCADGGLGGPGRGERPLRGLSATRACSAWTPRSIPTSLGVNPSLTIAAVCERAAAHLTNAAPIWACRRGRRASGTARPG